MLLGFPRVCSSLFHDDTVPDRRRRQTAGLGSSSCGSDVRQRGSHVASPVSLEGITKGETLNEPERTRPNAATRATEQVDARVEAHPDDAPTTEEEEAAARAHMDDESARSYKAALERGARQEGEGRVP
jgi:hypothetical protein